MRRSSVIWQTLTSSMTEQMCLTHWVMACGVPEIVTALSVESGNMSPATWTWAPVVLTLPYSGKKKQRLFSAKNPMLKPRLKCCFKQPQITPNTFWRAESSCKPNRNLCSNILRGAHKYCPFRVCMHSLLVFLGIIIGIFMSSGREKPHKQVLKKKINEKRLTGVFDTCSLRTPKKIFSPRVLKKTIS